MLLFVFDGTMVRSRAENVFCMSLYISKTLAPKFSKLVTVIFIFSPSAIYPHDNIDRMSGSKTELNDAKNFKKIPFSFILPFSYAVILIYLRVDICTKSFGLGRGRSPAPPPIFLGLWTDFQFCKMPPFVNLAQVTQVIKMSGKLTAAA